VTKFDPEEWVTVTGQVDFQQLSPNRYITVVRVPSKESVQKSKPDFNPYIQ
jgi:uncharacterized membrane protein YcgQ (UPF0703/DUF1980 family)